MCLTLLSLPAVPALAVDVVNPACTGTDGQALPAGQPQFCKENGTNGPNPIIGGPNSILAKVVNILSLVSGVVAVIVILIGGVKMITSSGDSNSVASARQTVMYAVVSIIIVVFAQIIVRFLLSRL
jgi:hypothetical protein